MEIKADPTKSVGHSAIDRYNRSYNSQRYKHLIVHHAIASTAFFMSHVKSISCEWVVSMTNDEHTIFDFFLFKNVQ
jgi:hypothetical protein